VVITQSYNHKQALQKGVHVIVPTFVTNTPLGVDRLTVYADKEKLLDAIESLLAQVLEELPTSGSTVTISARIVKRLSDSRLYRDMSVFLFRLQILHNGRGFYSVRGYSLCLSFCS
jgi:hypothetical protein